MPGTWRARYPTHALSAFRGAAARGLVKLEVISPHEMAVLRVVEWAATLYNVVYLVVVTALARGPWARDAACLAARCDRADFRRVAWWNFVSIAVVCAFAVVYFVYFVYLSRFRASGGKRPEVNWATFLLLPAVVVTNNPVAYLDRISVLPSFSGAASSRLAVIRYVTVAYCVCAFILYFILKFGALERDENLDEPYTFRFYAIRVSLLAVLCAGLIAAGICLRIDFSPQPLVPLVALARNDVDLSKRALAAVIAIGLIQITMVAVFLVWYYYASRRVHKLSYFAGRMKVMNLWFFFRHACVPILLSISITSICAALFPTKLTGGLQTSSGRFSERYILDVPYYARSGIVVVYTVYVVIESFCVLPSQYRPTWIDRMLLEKLGVEPGSVLVPVQAGTAPITTAEDNERPSPMATEPDDKEPLELSDMRRAQYASMRSMESVSDAAPMPLVWKTPRDDNGKVIAEDRLASRVRMDEVILLFNASWLAYLSDADMKTVLSTHTGDLYSLRQVWRDPVLDLVAYAATSHDSIIVSFRGTVSNANWRINMQISQAAHEPLRDPEWLKDKWRPPTWGTKRPRAHKGFWLAYLQLRDAILECIKRCRAEKPAIRVLLTGHSMGGALATLCAFDCRMKLGFPNHKVSVVTFGSPKVGSLSFCRRYAAVVEDVYRFVNHSDFVTNVPKRLLHGYAHVPRGVLIDGGGTFIVGPTYSDLKLFHGNAAAPHVLSAYRDSLHAFVKMAGGGTTVDFWDFDKIGHGAEVMEKVEATQLEIGRDADAHSFSALAIVPKLRRSYSADSITGLQVAKAHQGAGPQANTVESVVSRSGFTGHLAQDVRRLPTQALDAIAMWDPRNAKFREFESPESLLRPSRSRSGPDVSDHRGGVVAQEAPSPIRRSLHDFRKSRSAH